MPVEPLCRIERKERIPAQIRPERIQKLANRLFHHRFSPAAPPVLPTPAAAKRSCASAMLARLAKGGASPQGFTMPDHEAATRYRANLQGEVDGAALYRALADAETDPRLKDVYGRLPAGEASHAEFSRKQLHRTG